MKKAPSLNVQEYDPGWGSHLPLLIKLLNMTTGPVLELGTGVFSTPVMHALCADKERMLVSYETDKEYFEKHQRFETKYHQLHFVDDWKNVDLTNIHWSVVLIDQHPVGERKNSALQMANNADFIALHDANGRFNRMYHYNEVYPEFKYMYIYDKLSPHTAVVSNIYDLKNFKV